MTDYFSANRVCDLIMKGGITSGVVYPPAIDVIAQRFYFSGVGGASAGAIAAGLAAAAEYRRRNGSAEGFEQLRRLPEEISGPGRMVSLFRPDAATKPLFNLFLKSLRMKEDGGWFAKTKMALSAAKLLIFSSPLKAMVDNGHGLCTAMANGNRSSSDLMQPLTEWLSDRIDGIAGLTPSASEARRPLTFGDLWNAPKPPQLADTLGTGPSIKLQLVSTCLTFGRPYSLPHLDNRFAFNPDEFRRLFPAYVVDYMVQAAKSITTAEPLPDGLLPLPTGAGLPVIVAVRMSLSFPALFTLVPFYYRNFHETDKPYEKVYFADGGITSNLPMHYFDSPFPRWPTFAINLQYTQKPGVYGRSGVEPSGVWTAKSNSSGTLELFNRFLTAEKPLGQIMGLAGAIFRSAQVWTDNSFLPLPGYRDRVVELWLDPNEGGMNLEMPKSVIDGLVAKGTAIGQKFVARFADAPGTEAMSWDGHRWVRYRSSMAALAAYLRAWRQSVEHPMPGDRPLWDLLQKVDAVPSYQFKTGGGETAEAKRAAVEAATRALMACAQQLDTAPVCRAAEDEATRPFCDGPKPAVTLQARAPLAPDVTIRNGGVGQ